MKLLLASAILFLVSAVEIPEHVQTGPLTLMITYHCDPADRAVLYDYLEEMSHPRLSGYKEQGWLKDFQLLYSWYVNEATWDAMLYLEFDDYRHVEEWRKVERKFPGGLSGEILKVVKPKYTYSADVVRSNSDPEAKLSSRDSVVMVIPYRYLTLVDEYVYYADGYVIPQLEGWIREKVLASYKVLLNRFPTGDPWSAMLILEYRNHEAFGLREHAKRKVRLELRKNPEWKSLSDRKRTIRQEGKVTITSLVLPDGN